jgi:hypothetical protein
MLRNEECMVSCVEKQKKPFFQQSSIIRVLICCVFSACFVFAANVFIWLCVLFGNCAEFFLFNF